MAKKFIVFVVFAAVAQASLVAATESSIIENARELSRISWRAVGETICNAVANGSWPIETAKEEFRQHLVDAGNAFLEVAPFGDRQDLRNEGLAATNALREGVFKALEEARNCTSYNTTIAGIREDIELLPHKELTEAFQKFTRNTDPTDSAQELITNYYGSLFAEIENLANYTCGGQEFLGACDLEGIYSAIDAVVDTVFGWIKEETKEDRIMLVSSATCRPRNRILYGHPNFCTKT